MGRQRLCLKHPGSVAFSASASYSGKRTQQNDGLEAYTSRKSGDIS
jgi:hypothetical protein